MLLYIIRHGDPVYNPDSLTPLGELQAAALAKRLALYGIDEIYSSPLKRAQMTAQPTCDLLKKEMQIEEWTSEAAAWQDFVTHEPENNTWVFFKRRAAMRQKRIADLGDEWYRDEIFSDTNAERGYKRISDASDAFLKRLGYSHDRENRRYVAENHNDKRIAVFCHQGFGVSWLGILSDISLPLFWTGFDYNHSCFTVVEFKPDRDGLTVPQVLTLSNDSHIYREGLPVKYQNRIYF